MNEQNKTENSAAVSTNETRRAWTDPVVTRIAIKRTMLGSGSHTDSVALSTG